MKLPRQLSPYHRRFLFFSVLYLIGSLIALYGIMVTIKTDMLNAEIRTVKDKLAEMKSQNEKLATKIESRSNLSAVDNYATTQLKMGPPKTHQVILLER